MVCAYWSQDQRVVPYVVMINSSTTHERIIGNLNDQFSIGAKMMQKDRGGLFLCFSGNGRVRLDGVEYHLSAGDLCLYFPMAQLDVLQRSEDLDGIVMTTDMDSVQPLVSRVMNIDSLVEIRQHPIVHLTNEQMQRFRQFIDLYIELTEMERLYAEAGNEHLWQLTNLQAEHIRICTMLEIILVFSHDLSGAKTAVDRKDELVRRFLTDLRKNYRTEHEVGFYAERQCLSMRYFSYVIRGRTGRTPSQWIANALLTDAKQLLTETEKTVKEISELLHFPNQSYFGKWLKERTGVGPLEFKKTVRMAES